MSKLARKSAKLFAENATAAAGGLAQFGSLAAGTPNYSTDPDVIQALQAYSDGWSAAVLGTKSPALEDRNALDYLLSYQQAYLMQHGIPEWLDTETYYENSYVVDSNGELRVSTIDNNTGNDPVLDEGGQYWGYAGARGAGKQIGEVYYSQSSLATDNKGALPLFTGETIANADNLYPQFYAWVNTHTELQISAADYATALSTYGECPKYVIDTVNKTIRLPLLKNYIKMANTTDKITQSGAGLPNITGHCSEGPNATVDGAFSRYGAEIANAGGGGTTHVEYQGDFNASRSSAIYGASNTVTPTHTTLYPWVCAYNGAAPASMAQAAQFQQALTGKADVDLSNVSGTSGFRKLTEVYNNGSSWYKVFDEYDPTTGTFIGKWCEQGGTKDFTSYYTTVNLLKTYKDTNYTLLMISWGWTGTPGEYIVGGTKSTNQFEMRSTTPYSMEGAWRTEGYLDEGE